MTRLYIIDTNVLVAGLLTGQADSPTARLLDSMLNGSLMFLLSPALLAAWRTVLPTLEEEAAAAAAAAISGEPRFNETRDDELKRSE